VNAPYYKDNAEELIPTEQNIADNIGEYVDTMFELCLDDFSSFAKQGYSITHEKPISSVRLSEELLLETTMPVTITTEGKTQTQQHFAITLNTTQFYEDVQLAREIASTAEGGEVCLSCFSEQAQQAHVFVALIHLDHISLLIELQDKDYVIDNNPVHFRFAARYDNEI
jgi:hypothetical protein